MTAKEIFLQRIKTELEVAETNVKRIKEAYENTSHLPDFLFENLTIPDDAVIVPTKDPNYEGERFNSDTQKVEPVIYNDYGRNKRLVFEIVNKEQRPLLKLEIVKKFEELTGLESQAQVVTNAIMALSSEHVIVGYKPDGPKFRGNYWALKEWMEGGKIKKEHEPKPYIPIKKYLISA